MAAHCTSEEAVLLGSVNLSTECASIVVKYKFDDDKHKMTRYKCINDYEMCICTRLSNTFVNNIMGKLA